MRIAIRHQLSVTPPAGTANAVLQLLLTPQGGPTQSIESWSVEMAGIGNAGRFIDAYGNIAHLVNQSRPEGELVVTVKGVIETTDRHGVLGRIGGEPVPALYRRVTPLTKAPVALYGKYRNAKETRLDILHGLMARVGEALGVDAPGQSQMQADGGQSQGQGGVAKPLPPASDYAHSFVGGARALDIPARYVTGYLMGAEGGVAAFHAWAEAFDDGLGWIGFDPRLQICPTDRHVRLAAGLDGLSTQPLRLVPAEDGVRELEVSVAAA
ncbi:Transglutaminase-like domain protein [Devosia sp. LC5]|uniref:transglutaminase family protein n=1 Tax=Devosia sp. LC5 TaxID=1502724 RepID=UPI0004E3AA8F|nr:transglutaminase family protein [Devosia sp. LC5]KFC68410.1 Transglutaminase-like domain protein [Devosia sp. LC5]